MKNPAAFFPCHASFRAVLLAILAAVSLLLAQSAWQAYETVRAEVLRSEANALWLAESVASYQQSLLDHTAYLLRVLGGISLPDTGDPAGCSTFLARQLAHFPEYDNLAFSDVNGAIECSALPMPENLSSPFADFSASAPGKLLLFSLNRDFLAFALQHVSVDGRPDGMIIVSLSAAKFFQEDSAPNNVELGLIDGGGRLVSAYPSPEVWTGVDLPLPVLSPATVTPGTAPDGVEWLYVSEPVRGAAHDLTLMMRLPANTAAGSLVRMAALMAAALVLAGLSLWALGGQAVAHWSGRLEAIDWKQFNPAVKIKRAIAVMRHRIRQACRNKMWRRAHGTTVLRTAYEELKYSFAQEEERMRQISLLDELSQMLQGCISRAELAERVARCASGLFPGAGGALLLKVAPDTVKLTFAWGGSTHHKTFHPQDCWALRAGRPYHAQQPGAVCCAHMKGISTNFVCIPLMANSEILGVLHLAGLDGSGSERSVPWAATSLAERTAVAVSAFRRQEQLQFRATRDALTGLYNRRFMEEALAIEQRRARRRNSSIGVMMVDLDYFKRFNDTFGHGAGDALLHGIGRILRNTVREGDMPCRYGGEEFVVILPGADIDDTRQRAETLRATIERWTPLHQGRSLGPVTASIGIAAFPLNGDSWQAALKVADQALYEAKHQGRNRVAAQQPGGQPPRHLKME